MSRTSIALFIVTILAGVGALILMSGVIKSRRARMEAVESRLETLDGLGDQILEDNRVSDAVSTQLLTVRKEWGRVWGNAGQVQIDNPAQGVISLGIGENAGLGRGVRNGGGLPNFHLYGVSAGETKYIGEFQATSVEPAQTVAKLERLPFAGETDTWNYDGYRVRESIPPSYNALVGNLVTARNVATQSLEEEVARVGRANGEKDASTAILDLRLDELNGNEDADPATDEVRAKGLVAILAERSATRDGLAASVDRLRRTYNEKSNQLSERLNRIRQLATQLPGETKSSGTADLGAGIPGSTIAR